MKPDKQPPSTLTVDREQFTAAIQRLIETPPLPKAAIPPKRKPKATKSEKRG